MDGPKEEKWTASTRRVHQSFQSEIKLDGFLSKLTVMYDSSNFWLWIL